jgi:hypothetical protein
MFAKYLLAKKKSKIITYKVLTIIIGRNTGAGVSIDAGRMVSNHV